MRIRRTAVVLAAALLGAGVLAVVRADQSSAAAPAPPPQADSLSASTFDEPQGALPPNHPPIGGSAVMPAHAAAEETPAIAWTAPAAWKVLANPSTIRLATYGVSSTDTTELSVSRAGGDTEANIQRWIGQFDDAGKDTREEKTVHGFKVTIVTVGGTYEGGGMTASSTPHAGWALLAAIVETPGAPYFFKMTGPAASVRAARPAFDGLIASITAAR